MQGGFFRGKNLSRVFGNTNNLILFFTTFLDFVDILSCFVFYLKCILKPIISTYNRIGGLSQFCLILFTYVIFKAGIYEVTSNRSGTDV
jgi:hypothetical protein